MIELNGSYGEGGGALVRVALALSTITGQEFKVTNVRAGREQGGLKAQHLTAFKALKELCQAETNEVQLGSTSLWFKPGKIKSGRYDFDIGTAGSITLFLQAIILPCLFAPAKVTMTIKGGTCGKWQASVDYLQQVLLPQLKRFAEKIELKIMKRGYYPKGGGEILLEIRPKYLRNDFDSFTDFWDNLKSKVNVVNLVKQGELEQIRGIINISKELEEQRVAEHIRIAAEAGLRKYNVPVNIRLEYASSLSTGGEVLLLAIFSDGKRVSELNPIILAGDALIEKVKRSEEVAREAVEELKLEMDNGACVDHHLVDQLIPFMGLLPGSSITVREVSSHTMTNIEITEKFLSVKFDVAGNKIRVQ